MILQFYYIIMQFLRNTGIYFKIIQNFVLENKVKTLITNSEN